MTTEEVLIQAKATAPKLLAASSEQKDEALEAMADALLWNADEILSENEKDRDQIKDQIKDQTSDYILDRLSLTSGRIQAMAEGILEIAALPDPVGKVLMETKRPNGLRIQKKTVPLGVVAIIYESKPKVTSDAAALCIKSGNACILRCSRTAFNSADAIVKALRQGLEKAGLPMDLVQLIQDTSRDSARALMTANGYVDLLIPRGGAGLTRACRENATVNCLTTGAGVCHVYVDKDADLGKAVKIIKNAKTSLPGAGNSEEVCIVHSEIADEFIPMLKKCLVDEQISSGQTPVELRLDEKASEILGCNGEEYTSEEDRKERIAAELSGETNRFLVKASPADYDTEFLDYILAVKVVDSLDEAIEHISKHSTGHSDAIITENEKAADEFLRYIDSAAVYVNASTRFTEGEQFGLGAEMGISTQKMHARGPIGLEELTSYKYVIMGDGQTR